MSIHILALLTVIYIPCTPKLFLLASASYVARMFGITAGFHRLLSHRYRHTRHTVGAFAS